MNGECCSFDNQEEYDRNHCDTMLSIIYDKSKSFTKEYKNIQNASPTNQSLLAVQRHSQMKD